MILPIVMLKADMYSSLLFHGNCITCHNETKTISAPSVIEFKKRYLKAFPKKKDFVKYMSKWVQHPDKDATIMHDAIAKHGLMPELGFSLVALEQITAYIYDTNFTKKHEGHKH